ncbi:protein draper-like [Saccostrea cucullata]|uniref:protein draper-like n=1 Tax=Saccostrea cuccullata TaxID=36930 RepID=UPI002ED1A190
MCKASFRNLMLLLLSSTEIVFLTNTTDCSVGYFGPKCELPCRFPSFGEGCQLACFCAKQHCDHIHGCKECPPGFQGKTCQQNCSYPYFGLNASQNINAEKNNVIL